MSELDDLLEAQGGQFTWSDAVAAGVSQRQVRAGLRDGRLAHVGRCAYIGARRLEPDERHRRRTVALLRARPGRVATHHSAAILHGLPIHGADLDVVHFARHDTSGRASPLWVLHRLPVGAATVTISPLGVPSVTGAVAAVQCAMLSGVRSGLVTIDAALRAGATVEDLAAAVAAYTRAPAVGKARAALGLGDVRRESPSESLAAYEFALLRLAVTPQWPITVAGQEFRADFRVDGTNVLIEIDGAAKYDADPAEILREKRREQALRDLGYEIVRFTWDDLSKRTLIRERIEAAMARCQGRPLLP